MSKSLVLIHSAGNHSNRLFQNIHFQAFSIENGIVFRNPTFKDMKNFFPCKMLKTNGGGYEKIRRHLHVPLPTIDFEDFSSDDQYELLKLVDSNTTVCVGGWGFRVHELTKKYQDLFKTEYTLKQQFYINNELYSKYLDLKKTGKTLIGVHVRRGDYKDWEDGKFFFNDDIYCSYMLRMKELLGNDVHFFIFANEESLNLNDSLAACCTFSKEDWFIDQYIMSQCDYLIGPPSTFTLWASYIGKAKYFHIGGDLEFSLSNFTSCIG